MPASVSPIAFRQFLEERIAQLLKEAESAADARVAVEAGAARERSRSQTAGQLNQAVRRMRLAADPEEICAALVDAAAAFAAGAALFRIDGETARLERARGVSQAAGQIQSLEIPLAQAPAMASVVESRDPMIAAAGPRSFSAALADFLALPADGRAAIFPLVAREAVVALVVAWGDVEGPAVELLAEVAGAVWSGSRKAAPEGLISIAPAEPAPPWEGLSDEEQRMHLRARRFARVETARIRLDYPAEVESGRAQRNLYEALAGPIDAVRASFRATYFEPCPGMVDYLHLELVRTLAHDDPELLGENYPGVLR